MMLTSMLMLLPYKMCMECKVLLYPCVVDNNFFQEFLLQIFRFSIVHFPIFNFILDTSPIPFSKIHDFLKNEKNTIVLVFGYPHISFNEKVKEIKMYETEEN